MGLEEEDDDNDDDESNFPLWNYCVGKKILDLWISKMYTPEEFENLWVFGLKFSENVHSIIRE